MAACRLCPEWEFQSSNILELTEQHRWTTDYWLSGVRERRRRKPLQRATQGNLVGTELSLMEVIDITILYLKLHRTTHTQTDTQTHAQISACIVGQIQIHSVDCTDVNSWFLSLIMVVLDGNLGGGGRGGAGSKVFGTSLDISLQFPVNL